MRAAVDSFCSEFTTVKRTVIRSKALRIPEILFTVVLVCGMCFFLMYHVNFLTEVQLVFDTHLEFKHTMANWWTCDSESGNCVYDLPELAYTDYCAKKRRVRVYDAEKKRYSSRERTLQCRPFDVSKDLRLNRDSMWLTTFVTEMHEARDGANATWRQVPQRLPKQVFTVGAEQMVALSAALPQGLGINSMGRVQSFLKSSDGTEARIPCARSGKMLPDCPDVPAGKYWSSHYPTLRWARARGPGESAATNTADDFFAFNSTGCIQVVTGDSIVCHLHELLRAAGVDLDRVDKGKLSSPRTRKLTLYVLATLTNRVGSDYWRWPIGSKPKFVFEVRSGQASSPLVASYEYDEMNSTSRETRRLLDHYGIELRIYSALSWGVFDLKGFIGVVVIALGVLKYGNMVVTSVLVYIYSLFSCCAHVSRLYRFNAVTHSAMGKDVKGLLDHTEFKSRNVQANNAYRQQLFRIEASADGDSDSGASCSDSSVEPTSK